MRGAVHIGIVATALAIACGGSDVPVRETDTGIVPLTSSEAEQLKSCVKALKRLTAESAVSTVEGALLFADACVPGCDGGSWEKKDAWIGYADRCAPSDSKRRVARELIAKGAAWLAEVSPRAHFSHPVYAQRLQLVAPHARVPLPIEARAPGFYQLATARRATPSFGRIYVVVTAEAARVGLSGIERVDLSSPTSAAPETFPGKITRLGDLAARIAKRENWEDAGRLAPPLLLADGRLPAIRLREVVAVLADARLGVSRHGYALAHPMPIRSTPVPPIKMPLLVLFPDRVEIEQGLSKAAVRNAANGPNMAAVGAAITETGGVPQAGLAVALHPSTTVRQLVLLLDYAAAHQVPQVTLVNRP